MNLTTCKSVPVFVFISQKLIKLKKISKKKF